MDTMNRTNMVIAVAIGATLVIGGLVWSYERAGGKKEVLTPPVERAVDATVTIDQAIKTASENFPGKVIEAGLEKKHDRTVWEVDIVTAEQGIMTVHIDGESGSVIDTDENGAGKTSERDGKSDRPRTP
ncbi:MAG: hypothetical protein E8D45_10450 [Nitrospira sp.]|nr:MAG: hypothetical protein E8D45_10450 [Nitrospira sp.]